MDSWRLGKIAVINKPKAIFEEKMTKFQKWWKISSYRFNNPHKKEGQRLKKKKKFKLLNKGIEGHISQLGIERPSYQREEKCPEVSSILCDALFLSIFINS